MTPASFRVTFRVTYVHLIDRACIRHRFSTCGPAITALCVRRMNVGDHGLDFVEKRRGR